MDLIDKIKSLASKIEKQKDSVNSEEATKNAFILPFISALGYDVFDPLEVMPEFTADVGIKKGEKVDFAIIQNNEPIFLIECKKAGTNLNNVQASQLFRYYSVTTARVGILTDGIKYRFYSDLDESNKMDAKPFLEFNILQIDESLINELKKFSKTLFNVEDMMNSASELKYTKEIKHILNEQFNSPTEDFIRYFINKIYSGRTTQSVLDLFTPVFKKATSQFLNEKINDRLKSAMSNDDEADDNVVELDEAGQVSSAEINEIKIVTTEDEMDGYYIVKSILRNSIDPKRIFYRDTQSYFGILLDDNNRKPICRLRFNHTQKYLGTFDENKVETKHTIDDLNEIYKHAEHLINCVNNYEREEA